METINKFTFYWSIPKRTVWSALALIGVVIFGYFQFIYYITPGMKEIWFLNKTNISLEKLFTLMWVPIISYILLGISIGLLIRIFKPLKSLEEKGLVLGLIVGLLVGLGVWLIVTFGVEISQGLGGLCGGLVVGIVVGTFKEFES